MTEYDFGVLPVRSTAAKPLTQFELGEIDGKAARASGTYTTEERTRFIRTNASESDRYTQGFISGLRS